MTKLLIKNGLVYNENKQMDILIEDGVITRIEADIEISEAEGHKILNVNGKLISAPFSDPHIHLGTALTAGEPN